MKELIQLEELFMLAVAVYALYLLKVDGWVYLLLFLGPDISMTGYLFGNKAGAILYNIFHHKGLAIVLFICGIALSVGWLQVAGIIVFGHSSMDRALGYGLKHFSGFQDTHLGKIGKTNPEL